MICWQESRELPGHWLATIGKLSLLVSRWANNRWLWHAYREPVGLIAHGNEMSQAKAMLEAEKAIEGVDGD